jgi:glycosyltransferase involved in cell wall biosynthesis
LWLHDLLPISSTTLLLEKVSGVFVQSQFHQEYSLKSSSRSEAIDNVYIVPNGANMNIPCDGPNHNDVFIYGSSPNRGLEEVLKVWAIIKRHIPTATLEVYYGFTENVDIQLSRSMGKDNYFSWKKEMLALLDQEGVFYMGSVDHYKLLTAYSRAGFILYPTMFQETGCITIMKAMACGCIPITSRLKESVLFNLTKGFDLGPDEALNLTIAKNVTEYNIWINEFWLPSVLRVTTYSYPDIKQLRLEMKEYGRSMTWQKSATIMASYFK